jgi:DNA-3-methyladenine glycosylase II
VMGMQERPSEKQVRAFAENWRPHRGALAIFSWHHYKIVPV